MNYEQIKHMFEPKVTDLEYMQPDQLKISLICRIDSYKFSHPFAYKEGIKAMSSYGESRLDASVTIVPFGMQLLAKRYLSQTITYDDVDAAEAFSVKHFGRKLFDRAAWEKVVRVYKGKLPLIIRCVPEGTVMKAKQPIYTVTVFDEDLFWMSAGFETMIQRGIWYPTTIATMGYEIKNKIRQFYIDTDADMGLLPFSLHDFGGRGVTCAEQAEIGGAAHMVNFMGSDTVEGILTANFYYDEEMSGFSVYATEHSIECSFGGSLEGAREYLTKQLSNAVPGSIISIVLDGYDVYREAKLLCTEFRDQIIASGCKVVFRPDSGNMMEVIPRLLKMQEEAFGYTLTKTGHKMIKYVGIIQGDGVDHQAIVDVLTLIAKLGYAASCVIFGSGGALLQKVNRDSLKFAQKACSIFIGDEWVGIAKDPITDHGKKSKEGILSLGVYKNTGETVTIRIDDGSQPDDVVDIMQLVYHTGRLFNSTKMSEVRMRVGA